MRHLPPKLAKSALSRSGSPFTEYWMTGPVPITSPVRERAASRFVSVIFIRVF